MKSEDAIKRVTTELSNELLMEQLWPKDEVAYRPVPDAKGSEHSAWRIRFELSFDSRISLGLDINGEVALGRSHESNEGVVIDMGELADAEQLGVSRRHALLRPSDTKLYILDLESTNGTWLNNYSIGVNMPYSLSNGDLLRLGRLEFVVKIIKQPQRSIAPKTKVELVEALPPIARAIVSNLDLKAVLKQTMEMIAGFTPADEITVWLVDEQTGELFLEAGRGMNEEQITRMPVSNTLAGTVI